MGSLSDVQAAMERLARPRVAPSTQPSPKLAGKQIGAIGPSKKARPHPPRDPDARDETM